MTLFNDMFEGWGSGILIGVGVALAAPIVLPALVSIGRPIVKTAIKGGVIFGDMMKKMTAEIGEQLSDMVAEVKAECAARAEKNQPAAIALKEQSVQE